jgi:trk system potassium uptake protein
MQQDPESVESTHVYGQRVPIGLHGVLSRTTLSAALVLSMALDLTLFRTSSLHVPFTAVQTGLMLLVAFVATRRPATSVERLVQRRSRRTTVYVAGVLALALMAVTQKWSIALQDDFAVRLAYAASYRVVAAALTLSGVVLMLGGGRRLTRYFAAFAEQPARQTALSFAGMAVLGAFLLSLPICVRDATHVSFLNALFMATSAVCVTGLSIFDIAAEYTIWGQAVLLALVQIGGLGIMVLSASLVVLTGRKLRPRSSAVLAEVLDTESVVSLRGSIRRIVLFTLTIEALGASLLYAALSRNPHMALDYARVQPMAEAESLLWSAVFHAVSAFCNAGFTLTRANMAPFVSSYGVCSVVMALIVLGGLGFPVLSELWDRSTCRIKKRRSPRMTLHTRTVLALSSTLTLLVAALLASVEWTGGALAALSWHERLFAALFQSVTLRTAGFNTVDFASFSSAGLMLCMLFMFVGASPGGTGGGVKVTTFAVLFATLRAELRGHDEPYLFDRRLPAGTIRRAISLGFVGVIVVTVSVFLLLLTERAAPIRLAFEAVSAFATVGLSTNLTPSLGSFGKVIIILTMLIGRVGPLTVALAASERDRRAHHHRPHERVLIG